MIRIYNSDEIDLKQVLKREDFNVRDPEVERIVDSIIARVKEKGDEALLEYSEKFDGTRPAELKVDLSEIEEAYASVAPALIETMEEAADNITRFHTRQKRENFIINEQKGVLMGQRVIPLERVGIYVPGGTAAYPSSVLMNAIPAKIAGVKEIIMVTPPGKDGKIPAVILAAAKVAGVTSIFRIGGAQAIAALAYGTESIPKVDKITGPGNIYVATCKQKVFGRVSIDMVAGPSEILILADGTCDPAYVAADMLGQAEHDELAASILVTDSRQLAEAVSLEIEKQIESLPRRDIARASIDHNGAVIVTPNMEEAVWISNYFAPEHLELCVDDPFALLNSITNAGSVFLGKNVPEALGDYFAGPNHVLPTGGTARFSSPLSVDDFVKKSSFIYYTNEALGEVQQKIVDFAESEGLHAHGRSISIRFED